MGKRARWTGAVAAIAVGATPFLALEPAEAGPPVRFHDEGSEVLEDFCDVEGLTVRHEWDVRGIELTKTRDGLIHISNVARGADTWTNLANDKTFTVAFSGAGRDHSVVDNGDGTLSIIHKIAGQQVVYGPDGERLFRDAGTVWLDVLIDHGGTPDDPSDDVFLDAQVIKVAGRADTADREFCADIEQFIG